MTKIKTLLAAVLLTTIAVNAKPVNAWEYFTIQDRLDDSISHFLSLYSKDGSIVMLISCIDNLTIFSIGSEYSNMNDVEEVHFRKDKEKAFTLKTYLLPDHSNLLFSEPIDSIKRFFGGWNLYMRTSTRYGDRIEADFYIFGLEPKIMPIRKHCNW